MLYTLAMNVYSADFYSWIMVCLANFVATQTLANLNDVQLAYHTEHERQEHSLYCHLNASHLIGVIVCFAKRLANKMKRKGNIINLAQFDELSLLFKFYLLSIRSTFRGVFVRYCLFWIYDGDIAGDDDDESDLRCLLLRDDDMPVMA